MIRLLICVTLTCLSVVFLLSVLSLGVSSQPITDSQRLFSIAVSRVQHLHLLAQRLFSDFVGSPTSVWYSQYHSISIIECVTNSVYYYIFINILLCLLLSITEYHCVLLKITEYYCILVYS